jgi:hypothetical protein
MCGSIVSGKGSKNGNIPKVSTIQKWIVFFEIFIEEHRDALTGAP